MSKKSARRERRRARMVTAVAEAAEVIALDAPLTINAAAGDEKKGPRRFEMLAYNGGTLEVSQYPLPIVIDLAGLEYRTEQLPTYFGHSDGSDASQLVGHSDRHDTSSGQLVVAGAMSAANEKAREVIDTHDNGYQWQASIGVAPYRAHLQEIKAGTTVSVNGQQFTGPIIVARRSVLRHIAILPEGADKDTKLQIAATRRKEIDKMTFQEYVSTTYGGTVPELTDRQRGILQAHFDDSGGLIEGAAGGLDAITSTHAKYVAAVESRAGKYAGTIDADKLGSIQAKATTDAKSLLESALSDGRSPAWLAASLCKTESQAALEMIRAERPMAPAIHGSNQDMNPTILACAFGKTAGLDVEKHYSAEVLEASDHPSIRGIGLQQILIMAAAQNGFQAGPGQRITNGNLRQVLQHAFPPGPPQPIEAAFSTHTLTTLLTDTGNKILLDGFMSIPQAWREVAAVRPVSDFKAHTLFRLNADLEYEEVGPTGEIGHGTLGQDSYTLQAKTYARMLGLTRQDIINDDLGALNDIRARLGLGAAIKINKVFWTLWLAARDGAAFWTAGRGNLLTGGGSALSESALNDAVAAFRNMKGEDGNHLNIPADRIVVGPTLEATAKKWYVSTEVRDTTASTKTPVANIHFDSFRPVPVPELEDSDLPGYSTTAWYMACDPRVLASASMCFLDGQQSPTIESADADFNTLGIQFRGYHDFGASMAEYRASVANDGA